MPARTARAPRPNAGIRAQYQKSLVDLTREMADSVIYWLRARYRAREDEIIAADASPTKDLEKELRALMRQWNKRFDTYAQHRARWLAKRVNTSTVNQLKGALKDAGLTVKFKNTRRINNILQATVAENVGLIKSIPQQMLAQVNTIVMQSVKNGRDMGAITREIEKEYGITRRRAIMIARDQTNKATEAASRARCQDIGVTHGFWMPRGGGKEPRTTHHGEMAGQRFELSKGLYDPQAERVRGGGYVGRNVKPGELINCHCTFKLDLSTIGNEGVAMDHKRGVMRVELPGATIEWGMTG